MSAVPRWMTNRLSHAFSAVNQVIAPIVLPRFHAGKIRVMPIATINPATGETLRTFDPMSADEVDARIERAAAAFAEYRLTSFADRAMWMRASADVLDGDVEGIARMMTTEMGKTIAAAR